jgi:hypothetical protein
MSEPRSYAFAAWLFLRLLGVVYLVAFLSLAAQIRGLVGAAGVLPACEVLTRRESEGIRRFWRLPTLCWLSASDRFLLGLCWGGAFFAALLTTAVAPLAMSILLWMFYLSLFNVCRLFLRYQWDVLLLECGFLAIFLAPVQLLPGFTPLRSPSPIILWLFWWLLFRLMFSSGFAKLLSGDRTWRNLTALCHHYETQPLPTPVSWYALKLPRWFHKSSALVVLLIEILGPIFIFGPTPTRYLACGAFIGLMLLIEITGNYAFFNLLGLTLSVLLLDDEFWVHLIPRLMPSHANTLSASAAALFRYGVVVAVALVIVFLSLDVLAKLFRRPLVWPRPLLKCLEFLAPFHLLSGYGLFSVMTTERPEIIVEGSDDGLNWRAYEFKCKPGQVSRGPRFVAPHQPRLDWQMWFAALGYCESNPWFVRFLMCLLEGSQPVIHLLRENPFPEKPPRYIRASLYDYRFTDRAQRKESRAWWRRERRGTYCPILEINDPSNPSDSREE